MLPTQPLATLLVVLVVVVVVAVVLHLIDTSWQLAPTTKTVIRVAVLLALLVYVLRSFGLV